MPIKQRNGKWYWGSKGPFDSRKKAEEVAQAAHASGYEGSILKLMKYGDTREIDTPGIGRSDTPTASGLSMPTDPKKRAKQVDREIGSKYVPQLVDDSKDPPPPMPGYENIHNMQKSELTAYGNEPSPIMGLPMKEIKAEGDVGKQWYEDFRSVNPHLVSQYVTKPARSAQYKRHFGGEIVSQSGDTVMGRIPHVPTGANIQHRRVELPNGYMNIPTHDAKGTAYDENYAHANGHKVPIRVTHPEDDDSHPTTTVAIGGHRIDLTHDLTTARHIADSDKQGITVDTFRDTSDPRVRAAHEEAAAKKRKKLEEERESGSTENLIEIKPFENALLKLIKEGAAAGGDGGDGGGFDGLSGTVFTSTNAGIFSPTHGDSKTKKRHRKQHKKQEKRRKKLLGKEKKSGVDRLVQFLYDGSPMKKSRKPNKDMTGHGATAHAWNNKRSGRKILNWQKVADGNTPNGAIGYAGSINPNASPGMKPSEENPSNNMKTTQRKESWGSNNYYVQKELKPLIKLGSTPQLWNGPNGNTPTESFESGNGTPQKAFIERDKDYETPGKDAVTKQNDSDRKIRDHDNKEDEKGNVHQPEAAMATKGMGNYPSAAMQMASFGSGLDTFAQDTLARGGRQDIKHEEDDIDEKERTNVWVSEDDIKKFDGLYKELKDVNDDTPLFTALHKVFHG